MGYRWVEHTSELELCIEAPSEEAVFEQALQALGALLADGQAGEGDGEADGQGESEGLGQGDGDDEGVLREVAVAAGDRAALLAAWLDELVYLVETEDFIPCGVERLRLEGEELTASVRARRGHPRHLVKGVTYHELSFAPGGDGFAATVVLDV